MSEVPHDPAEGIQIEAETVAPDIDYEALQKYGHVVNLLKEREIDPQAIGELRKVRVNEWQMVTKNKVLTEGGDIIEVPEVHQLRGTSVEFKPKKTDEEIAALDESMFTRQAAPTIVKPSRAKPRAHRDRTALIVPDHQLGWRHMDDEMQPIHDLNAMDVAQQLANYIQPDEIIVLGDNLDLPNMSRFGADPTVRATTQKSIDDFHLELAKYRANAPNAKITVLEGNHDERWMKYIRQNAAEVLGIRRANAAEKLSVLSLQFLLNLDSLEVEYLDGYPANRYWLNDNLKAIHGDVVRSSGSTAAAIANKETTSTLFGHIHRIESHHRTVGERHQGRTISAHSFGTLSRVDGAVPSYGAGKDSSDRPLTHYENWQQGVGLVTYKPGDGSFDIQTLAIKTFDGYETRFDNKVFVPRAIGELTVATA